MTLEFKTGVAIPGCFVHPKWLEQMVVHVDDFVAFSKVAGLDPYEAEMQTAFEVKSRGDWGTIPRTNSKCMC